MGAKAVIVVDMLRGFLEPGHPLFCGQEARRIVPVVVALLGARERQPVIYLADSHDPDDKEFKMFPPHCIKGSPESELIPELAPFPGRIVSKTRYSGFYGTNLEEILAAEAPSSVVVVGVCTDICVLHTVADLRNRDYPVEVPVGAVASFDEDAHRWALRHMERILGATLV